MVATTDQKARLLDLTTGILEMVRDGNRDTEGVLRVFQTVKDRPDFGMELLGAPTFKYDKTKDGWTLEKHVGRKIKSARGLKLVSFLKKGESYIGGEELEKRVSKLNADLGQEDAEWLLEHQEEIPKSFRKFYIVFTGTVWRVLFGPCSVPCLRWVGERWRLCFRGLGDVWFSLDRLVRPRK